MRCFLCPTCCDENGRLFWRHNDDSALIDVREVNAIYDVGEFPDELQSHGLHSERARRLEKPEATHDSTLSQLRGLFQTAHRNQSLLLTKSRRQSSRSGLLHALDFPSHSADRGPAMRIAVLYDIHANLPALEAVADDIRLTGVDRIVIGGDVLPGPMPVETLDFLMSLGIPVHFIRGNGELAVLAQRSATDDPATVKYWGTRTGEPLPEPGRAVVRWTAQQLPEEWAERVSTWPATFTMSVSSLGRILFCHGTPRSETEVFTRLTPDDRLAPIFEGVDAQVVVCGHTHMQFDRMVGRVRVVNAGSVGMPFEQPPAAYWLLLDPEVQLRQTFYDLTRAADRVRVTRYPQAEEFAARNILNPPDLLDAITAVSV